MAIAACCVDGKSKRQYQWVLQVCTCIRYFSIILLEEWSCTAIEERESVVHGVGMLYDQPVLRWAQERRKQNVTPQHERRKILKHFK